MNSVLALIVILSTTMLFGQDVRPKYEKAHAASHHIQLEMLLDDHSCSSVAIGPHALITATHCELGTDNVVVDGETHAVIVQTIRDDKDHSIFLLAGITFKDFVAVTDKEPLLGDDLFYFGNPGESVDIFRKGYMAGWGESKDTNYMLIDMNGFKGDSGAGVFNVHNEVVAIVSVSFNKENFKLMGAFPLAFMKDELKKAREFGE